MKEEMPKTLMRFTRLEDLFHMFEWGGIPLYDASRWDDQVDREFLKRETGGNSYGVMCFMHDEKEKEDKTLKVRETYAHWKVYAPGANVDVPSDLLKLGIRIDFDMEKLPQTARTGIRKVNYCTYDECRKREYDDKALGEWSWGFSKRNAYEWENEWRLLVMNDGCTSTKTPKREMPGVTAFIEVKPGALRSAIQQVVFSPFAKLESNPLLAPATECIRNHILDLWDRRCENSALCNVPIADEHELASLIVEHSYRSRILDNDELLKAAREG